jgi:hypothetical protein
MTTIDDCTNKYYRALIEVTSIYHLSDTAYVIIPQWQSGTEVPISTNDLPEPIKSELRPGYMMLAYATIGVEKPEDMKIKDFEWVDQNPPEIE